VTKLTSSYPMDIGTTLFKSVKTAQLPLSPHTSHPLAQLPQVMHEEITRLHTHLPLQPRQPPVPKVPIREIVDPTPPTPVPIGQTTPLPTLLLPQHPQQPIVVPILTLSLIGLTTPRRTVRPSRHLPLMAPTFKDQ
jgi:hypothetical protein